jgi:crotonobetainyl-CoA:carnitine CoA-transferase CaiB-like acyl-CoA transferase
MEILGVGGDERFGTFAGRTEHRDELEAIMADWCSARSQTEVLDAFTAAEAAIGPVYDMADIADDPHYTARQAIADVDGTPMQGLIARLSETPGELRWAGRTLDADGDEIRRSGWA